jgi:hypothetical protein
MKTYGGKGVECLISLTSAIVVVGEWSVSCPVRFTPGEGPTVHIFKIKNYLFLKHRAMKAVIYQEDSGSFKILNCNILVCNSV